MILQWRRSDQEHSGNSSAGWRVVTEVDTERPLQPWQSSIEFPRGQANHYLRQHRTGSIAQQSKTHRALYSMRLSLSTLDRETWPTIIAIGWLSGFKLVVCRTFSEMTCLGIHALRKQRMGPLNLDSFWGQLPRGYRDPPYMMETCSKVDKICHQHRKATPHDSYRVDEGGKVTLHSQTYDGLPDKNDRSSWNIVNKISLLSGTKPVRHGFDGCPRFYNAFFAVLCSTRF